MTIEPYTTPIAGRLAPKIALITGASQGIGAAIARLFAREGAGVMLAARNLDALDSLVAEIQSNGGAAVAVPTDITEAASVEALVTRVVDTYGRLDIAVNSVGIAGANMPLTEVTEETFERVINVNLKGMFLALKYEIPALTAAGGGAIVNISSTVGLVGSGAGIAPYVASKHAVVGLTKAAALEYARYHIRVNGVAPGTTRTPINEHWISNEQILQHITSTIPLGRVAEAPEIAQAALWLCSDAASYIIGVTLLVDGGSTVA